MFVIFSLSPLSLLLFLLSLFLSFFLSLSLSPTPVSLPISLFLSPAPFALSIFSLSQPCRLPLMSPFYLSSFSLPSLSLILFLYSSSLSLSLSNPLNVCTLLYIHCTYSSIDLSLSLDFIFWLLIFCGLFLKHPYKRFCFFIFLIFTKRDLSRTMVRRVWTFLLPADHGIGGLICPCLVAWSPWFIFLLYTYDYLYFILFSFQIVSSFVRDSSYHDMYYKGCGLLCAHKKSFNTAIPVRSLGP